MSFVTIPVGSGPPVDGVSLPNSVSFGLSDDGAGGSVFLNGLGVLNATVTGAVDLKTYFGSPKFRSIPLLRAFRAMTAPSAANAEAQFLNNLAISIYPLTTGLAAMPAINYLAGLPNGPANVPYLSIVGPAVAGNWRIEIRLRHSITN